MQTSLHWSQGSVGVCSKNWGRKKESKRESHQHSAEWGEAPWEEMVFFLLLCTGPHNIKKHRLPPLGQYLERSKAHEGRRPSAMDIEATRILWKEFIEKKWKEKDNERASEHDLRWLEGHAWCSGGWNQILDWEKSCYSPLHWAVKSGGQPINTFSKLNHQLQHCKSLVQIK